jgi:hypothetical protein
MDGKRGPLKTGLRSIRLYGLDLAIRCDRGVVDDGEDGEFDKAIPWEDRCPTAFTSRAGARKGGNEKRETSKEIREILISWARVGSANYFPRAISSTRIE